MVLDMMLVNLFMEVFNMSTKSNIIAISKPYLHFRYRDKYVNSIAMVLIIVTRIMRDNITIDIQQIFLILNSIMS